jgi:hypothetical protein
MRGHAEPSVAPHSVAKRTRTLTGHSCEGPNTIMNIWNDPRLYAVAKQITLRAGMPYTDPRTGETTQPQKPKMNTGKKPAWILLDQLHVSVNIKPDMPAKERKELIALINSKTMKSLFESIIAGPHRNKIQVKVSK